MEGEAASGPGKEHEHPEDTGELGHLFSRASLWGFGPPALLRVMSTYLDCTCQQVGRVVGPLRIKHTPRLASSVGGWGPRTAWVLGARANT